MTAALVDSNVLTDVVTDDPEWAERSAEMLRRVGAARPLVIDPLIWSEGLDRVRPDRGPDAALPEAAFRREPLPWDAGFLAGKAFLAYRKRGGARKSPFPDLYIGAQAAACSYALVTIRP